MTTNGTQSALDLAQSTSTTTRKPMPLAVKAVIAFAILMVAAGYSVYTSTRNGYLQAQASDLRSTTQELVEAVDGAGGTSVEPLDFTAGNEKYSDVVTIMVDGNPVYAVIGYNHTLIVEPEGVESYRVTLSSSKVSVSYDSATGKFMEEY